MSDALYIRDENKERIELRYQQSRSRLVEMGNEIAARPRTTVVRARAAEPAERSADDTVAAFSSVFRPAKRRRMSFPKTGLWRY